MAFKHNSISILILLLIFSCNNKKEIKSLNIKLTAKEIYDKDVNNTVTVVTSSGLGSGFFVEKDLIITNYHVIKGENKAEVILNNSDKRINVLGYLAVDKINDLVLLKIDYKNNSYIKFENEIPKPGEKVFAIGSPIGLNKTISEGIVSGIRNSESINLLQITTPISHGSSGCPIINERGNLVGVAVGGIDKASNIGFCIPINYIKSLIDFKEVYPRDISKLNSSNSLTSTTKNAKDEIINGDKPQEVTTIRKPAKEDNLKNNAINSRYLGKHLFSAYTIGNDKSFGLAIIKYKNGRYYINAFQKNEKGESIKLNGEIKIINLDKFIFNGEIYVNARGYNSQQKMVLPTCKWSGERIFENKSGAYWRDQDFMNIDTNCFYHTSNIDIFIKN